ncbi:MAG TPA: pyridoxamine 5'-phosphate oxidase family protein [candidate division Zixibacteria bacterium]|nr:pyridoxamine 5'-phosphate oxidase family protein [candidate division Zixibacteria bacterium]MDD4916444.1 pyridoxamine 5'-phosphate oxidase family protein [candidate division Zixibacteria bacterium]MDM7972899.1 pyridoxamine 5'-phosphate oxidase family protein [candidate division Zixibacteria bacterium]HOD66412.1 pyridoxamine 5'-phosphate oxidase family protein [candidate division Zixibacteria bacterium]HOZ08933.1 pyridoxamine 5'-phosphate oxidase family protein [candidate division Zixibacteri
MDQHRADSADLHRMRRADRARDEAWISDLVARAPFCHIATVAGDQPFITPMSFAYDPDRQALYFHTAGAGRLRTNTERGSRVCVSFAEMGRLLPAKTARGFSVEYRSVIAFGRISLVDDPAAAARHMQMLIDRYFPRLRPGVDYRPIQPEEIEEISVYRIDIDAWSGKEKSAPDEFPGAFSWESR